MNGKHFAFALVSNFCIEMGLERESVHRQSLAQHTLAALTRVVPVRWSIVASCPHAVSRQQSMVRWLHGLRAAQMHANLFPTNQKRGARAKIAPKIFQLISVKLLSTSFRLHGSRRAGRRRRWAFAPKSLTRSLFSTVEKPKITWIICCATLGICRAVPERPNNKQMPFAVTERNGMYFNMQMDRGDDDKIKEDLISNDHLPCYEKFAIHLMLIQFARSTENHRNTVCWAASMSADHHRLVTWNRSQPKWGGKWQMRNVSQAISKRTRIRINLSFLSDTNAP